MDAFHAHGARALTHSCEPTVFLLDDDAAVRQSMSALTRLLQMPLEILASADDFLKKHNPLQHGCLVLEVCLPGMDGLELLEKLHGDGSHIAAIAISANADLATVVRAMRAGAITFLEKPLAERQLWDSLGEALARRGISPPAGANGAHSPADGKTHRG